MQLSTRYTNPEPSNSPPHNFQISLTMSCGYTICRTSTAKMSEQAKSMMGYLSPTLLFTLFCQAMLDQSKLYVAEDIVRLK